MTAGVTHAERRWAVTDGVEVTVDVTSWDGFDPNQHCTAEDCYTFSHTARYCGKPQPRFCECPYDYAAGAARALNGVVKATVITEFIRRFT